MALKEVFAFFGFEFDKAKLQAINGQVQQMQGVFGDLGSAIRTAIGGAIVYEAFHKVSEGIYSTINAAEELIRTSNQLQISAGTLKLWGYAAEIAGASTEELTLGLRKLTASLANAKDGTGNAGDSLKLLGINLEEAQKRGDTLEQILPRIVDGFGNLSTPAEKAKVAVDLFGRSGTKMIPFLAKGTAGLADLKAELLDITGGGAGPEFLKNIEMLREASVKLDRAIGALKSKLVAVLVPGMIWIAEKSQAVYTWFNKLEKQTGFLKSALSFLTFGALLKALPIILRFMPAILGFLAPLLSFVAAFLLFDDVLGFLQGKKSVVGDLIESIFGKGSAEKVRAFFLDTLKDAKQFFGNVVQGFKDLAIKVDDVAIAVGTLAVLIGGTWLALKIMNGLMIISEGILVAWESLSTLAMLAQILWNDALAGGSLAMNVFNASMAPVLLTIGAILLAVGGVTAAFYELYQLVKELGGVRAAWEGFKSFVKGNGFVAGNDQELNRQARERANQEAGASVYAPGVPQNVSTADNMSHLAPGVPQNVSTADNMSHLGSVPGATHSTSTQRTSHVSQTNNIAVSVPAAPGSSSRQTADNIKSRLGSLMSEQRATLQSLEPVTE